MARNARFLRISLRGLIILSTIACLWVGKLSIEARAQKSAVDRIRRVGGGVGYDWQEPVDVGGGLYIDPTGPSAPKWLRSLLGDDYFQKVTRVHCVEKTIDAFLVEGLPHLRDVSMIDCGISDLSPLADLSELRFLDVRRNCIVDLTPLATQLNLELLNLSDNQIVDCSPLLRLKRLTQLELQRNPIGQQQIDSLISALPDTAKTWSRP